MTVFISKDTLTSFPPSLVKSIQLLNHHPLTEQVTCTPGKPNTVTKLEEKTNWVIELRLYPKQSSHPSLQIHAIFVDVDLLWLFVDI